MDNKKIAGKLVRAGVGVGLGLIAFSFTRGFFKSAGKDLLDVTEELVKKFVKE